MKKLKNKCSFKVIFLSRQVGIAIAPFFFLPFPGLRKSADGLAEVPLLWVGWVGGEGNEVCCLKDHIKCVCSHNEYI